MRFLLVGGEGFIGKYVAATLRAMMHEVWSLDAGISSCDPIGQHSCFCRERQVIRGDARDFGTVLEAIADAKADRVINLACIPVEKWCSENPGAGMSHIIDTTSAITRALQELCEEGDPDPRRYVHISSSMVYGDFPPGGAREDSPCNPLGPYGGAKLASEAITHGMCRRFNIPYVIVRPCAVYGPGDKNRRVVQTLLENAIDGKTLTVSGDTRIDFTWIEDAAHGIVLAALSQVSGETFNIARGRARSLKDLVLAIQKCVPDLQVEYGDAPEHRPERGDMVITKARTMLNFCPQVDLEEGVARYYQWMKKQKEGSR